MEQYWETQNNQIQKKKKHMGEDFNIYDEHD